VISTSVTGGKSAAKNAVKQPSNHLRNNPEKLHDAISKRNTILAASGLESATNDTEESTAGIAAASQHAETQMQEIADSLGDEQIQHLEKDASARLTHFMRQRKDLLSLKNIIQTQQEQLILEAYKNNTNESPILWEHINKYSDEVKKTDDAIEQLARTSPEAFKAHWLLRLREYKKQFKETGMIVTPEIERSTADIMHDVKRKMEKTNGVSTILGPTGSGKTVLAKKVAAALSGGEEQYEFLSAHTKMGPEDILQRQGISVEVSRPENVPDAINDAKQADKEKNPHLDDREREERDRQIEEVVTGQAQEKAFQSKTILESVGRAAREGNIVVIDEFNYLPPETIASLNNLLATTPGEQGKITVGDSTESFTVAEGFGVIFTGNIGKEYIGRQEKWDPAFVNRVSSGIVAYDHPPQSLNQSFKDSILSESEMAAGQKPPQRDLFLIAETQLIDMKGNVTAPTGTLESTWRFSQSIALIQQLAAGKDFRELGIQNQNLQTIPDMKFDQFFLSFRNLNQIVREWKLDNFQKPIDAYIYDNIIRPASVIAPKEAAQMFYVFKMWGGFFDGPEWDDIHVEPSGWRISGIQNVTGPKDTLSTHTRHYDPVEVVEAAAGQEVPSYEKLGTQSNAESAEFESQEHNYKKVEQWLKNEQSALKNIEFIEHICEENNT